MLPKPKLQKLFNNLSNATSLADKTIRADQNEFISHPINPAILQEIKPLLQKPDWTCQTHNQIQGIVDNVTYNLSLDADYNLVLGPLIKAHTAGSLDLMKIFNQVEKPISPEVQDMLIDIALPRSLGILTKAHFSELIIGTETLESLKPKLFQPFYLELILEADIVRFDYSRLFAFQIGNSTLPTLILDSENFKDNVAFPLTDFLLNKPFHRSFSWLINLESSHINVDITLHHFPQTG